eukprot:788595-Amphidinium_carterae.1
MALTTTMSLHGPDSEHQEDERRHRQFQPDIELCVATCHKARQRGTLNHKESDATIQWFRILATATIACCRRPPSSTIFVFSHNHAAELEQRHSTIHQTPTSG